MRIGSMCARCGARSTTVVIGFSVVEVYLDLCEVHLADLLRHARPVDGNEACIGTEGDPNEQTMTGGEAPTAR